MLFSPDGTSKVPDSKPAFRRYLRSSLAKHEPIVITLASLDSVPAGGAWPGVIHVRIR